MMTRRDETGLALLEVLVATAIVLLLAGSLLTLAAPSHGGFSTQPASVDLVQRLRVAVDEIEASLRAAGSGPINPLLGLPLGAAVPCVLPYRIGRRQPDAGGAYREDLLTTITALPGMAAPHLASDFDGHPGLVTVAPAPGCPVGDAACGLEPGMSVLLVDRLGQSSLYGVAATDGARIELETRGPWSGRRHPAEAWVVPVEICTHYVRPSAGPDGPQLARYDGYQSDLPQVDHVVSLSFEYYGDPLPPHRRDPPGPLGQVVTYGPAPPAPGEDDDRDGWGAGENCVTRLEGAAQVPRLEVLGTSPRLQLLGPEMLTDGPWCPDAAAPGRYDADLLRIRKVRVRLRIEAGVDSVRGADPRLFRRPGGAADGPWTVPDREVAFEVVMRTLGGGR